MAGHSKWANTKHRKASQDFKKSKIFTKIIKELIIASKCGGENPDTNPNLRAVIEKALNCNMSLNTINRTINKKNSINNNSSLKRIQYGGCGKKGTAVILDCLSNNKNRTVAEIRYIFSKFNFTLIPVTSIEYLFKKKIVMLYSKNNNFLKIKNISIKYGAECTFNHETKYIKVVSNLDSLEIIKSTLNSFNVKPSYTELLFTPYMFITINPEENMTFYKFITKLKKNADIQNIYHNIK